MPAFMISVLGSLIFWIGYFVIGFFISTLLLRYLAPKAFKYTITGELSHSNGYEDDIWEYVIICILIYIFWPIILIFTIVQLITKILFKDICWPLFKQGVKYINNTIPEIEIKKKEK